MNLIAAAAIFFLMFVGVFQIIGRTVFNTVIHGYIDYMEQASAVRLPRHLLRPARRRAYPHGPAAAAHDDERRRDRKCVRSANCWTVSY
jgi:hypothetical protein